MEKCKKTINVEDAKNELIEIVMSCDGKFDQDTLDDLEWLGQFIAMSDPVYDNKSLGFLVRNVAAEKGIAL